MKKWFLKLLVKFLVKRIPKGVKVMFGKIIEFLSGKKMYLAAIALAIEAIVEYLGDGNLNNLITKLIAAWTIAAGKAAIVKSAQ